MNYKQFIKSEMDRASENEWFDPNGNNVIATSNRGFFAEVKYQISGFNYDILHSVDIKELATQLIMLVQFISVPITYIPFLLLRVFFTRKRAKKEMMESYNKKHGKT